MQLLTACVVVFVHFAKLAVKFIFYLVRLSKSKAFLLISPEDKRSSISKREPLLYSAFQKTNQYVEKWHNCTQFSTKITAVMLETGLAGNEVIDEVMLELIALNHPYANLKRFLNGYGVVHLKSSKPS